MNPNISEFERKGVFFSFGTETLMGVVWFGFFFFKFKILFSVSKPKAHNLIKCMRWINIDMLSSK